MGRRLIEVMGVLVDHVHKGGYQHRVLEDSIYAESQKRIAAEKERDHWRAARQDAMQAGELMQAEIERLRQQLADAQRAASDEFVERQVLTAEQQQDAAAWQQQVDGAQAEAKYLRDRLDEERSVIAGLRQKLTAAEAAVSLQRAGIERLQAELADEEKCRELRVAEIGRLDTFFERVRCEACEDPELYGPFARLVLEFNAGSMEPAPATAPESNSSVTLTGSPDAEGQQ